MNGVLCKTIFYPPSHQGIERGQSKVIAEGHTPPKRVCSSRLGPDSVPPSRKSSIHFEDPENPRARNSATSPSLLRLPWSLSISALSLPLKLSRFRQEKYPTHHGNVLRPVEFQDHGDISRVSMKDQKSYYVHGEELECSLDGTEPMKSVDMSNLISIARAESGTEDVATQMERMRSTDQMPRPIIQTFVKLKSFWKRENSAREASRSARTSNTMDPVESCQFIPLPCGCQNFGFDRSDRQLGNFEESIGVTPHLDIARDKTYFAKFLHSVPSSERKRITQMAHLSNLAYRIPTIERQALVRHHYLKVVTSSLELKALAAAVSGSENVATNQEIIDSAEVVHNLEMVRANASRVVDEMNSTPSLNPAAGYAVAATATSCNAQACDGLLSTTERDASELADEIRPTSRSAKDVLEKFSNDTGNFDRNSQLPNCASKSGAASSSKTIWSMLRAPLRVSIEQGAVQRRRTNRRVVRANGLRVKKTKQGTETRAAWQANLRFDPTQFEPDLKLGVMVHRGIYEAARGLYEEVLPLIRTHMEKNGVNGRLGFTGHSLGGSLATLLSLMVGLRNAAPVSALLPVYTFGSPCIMCGGNQLLEQLGLPRSHVRSIIMHMDIVPRTFACDYPNQVSIVLKRVSGTFRNHTCLLQQKLIYAPMGEIVILQPELDRAPGHPLLPPGSGLYILRYPKQDGMSERQNENPLRLTSELHSVERAFLNVPHPLDMLSDRNAYGSQGSIYRDHDSRNYLKTLHRMRRHELRKRRRALREYRRQLWAPLLENVHCPHRFPFEEHEKSARTVDMEPSVFREFQELESSDGVKEAGKPFQFFHFMQERNGSLVQNDHAKKP